MLKKGLMMNSNNVNGMNKKKATIQKRESSRNRQIEYFKLIFRTSNKNMSLKSYKLIK